MPAGWRPLGALVLAAGLLAATGHGGESRGFMQVRAAVLPRADIRVQAPASLTVSTADLQRGTASAAQPLQIRAWSNASHGLELDLQAPEGMFATLRVQGPGIDATLPGSGGSLAWRWSQRPGFAVPATLDLRVSFVAADSLQAGTYSWPVRINARPLAQ